MIVPILLFVGVSGSIGTNSWLPIIGALVISVGIHEAMLYDLHRHVLNLEEN